MTDRYKSPITLIFAPFQDMVAEQAKQFDDKIYEAIVRYDVQVDKEELLKALAYDRDQYHKGYHDGKQDAFVHAQWEMTDWCENYCSNCGQYALLDDDKKEYRSEYCPRCGALMDNGGDTDD